VLIFKNCIVLDNMYIKVKKAGKEKILIEPMES
jgi:hypothetical protein